MLTTQADSFEKNTKDFFPKIRRLDNLKPAALHNETVRCNYVVEFLEMLPDSKADLESTS